jgi:hypothetical protein
MSVRHEFGRQFEGGNVTKRAVVNAKYLRHWVSTRSRGFCYTTLHHVLRIWPLELGLKIHPCPAVNVGPLPS